MVSLLPASLARICLGSIRKFGFDPSTKYIFLRYASIIYIIASIRQFIRQLQDRLTHFVPAVQFNLDLHIASYKSRVRLGRSLSSPCHFALDDVVNVRNLVV